MPIKGELSFMVFFLSFSIFEPFSKIDFKKKKNGL